ncbi:hypothetical protein INR49_006578 [Caranx melampygus]|nr:hypothetical protein INR49_006578 [Caranx melampygus]
MARASPVTARPVLQQLRADSRSVKLGFRFHPLHQKPPQTETSSSPDLHQHHQHTSALPGPERHTHILKHTHTHRTEEITQRAQSCTGAMLPGGRR